MRAVIYISGPITLGDRTQNLNQAADAQRRLMARGISVVNPILTMLMPGAFSIPHEQWMENDLPIIARCDAVLRLPGESVGADIETAFAVKHNIPVFTSQFDLVQWTKENQSSSD